MLSKKHLKQSQQKNIHHGLIKEYKNSLHNQNEFISITSVAMLGFVYIS